MQDAEVEQGVAAIPISNTHKVAADSLCEPTISPEPTPHRQPGKNAANVAAAACEVLPNSSPICFIQRIS